MRQIAHLEDVALAHRLSDVLVSRGITNEARPEGAGAELWVHDDARLTEARELLAAFQANPSAYAKEVAQGAARRKEVARADEAYRARIRLAQRTMYGADGRGWVTLVTLVITGLVALITQVGAQIDLIMPLFLTTFPAGRGLPEVMSGEVWRLVTPIFVHFGVMHLFGNGTMWWWLAGRVEQRKGHGWMAVFVLATAAGSNLIQALWLAFVSPSQVALVGGLSGVLYALFGFAWVKGRIDPLDELEIPEQTWWWMMGWLLLCMTGAVGSVANAAHLGGLAIGAVAAWVDVTLFRLRKRR